MDRGRAVQSMEPENALMPFHADVMPEGISDPMRLAARVRGEEAGFTVTEVAEGTLHGIAQGVRISFLEYRYRRPGGEGRGKGTVG